MPSVSLSKKDVPFLLGGNGELSLDTGRLALNAAIPSDGAPILDVRFKADGEQSLALGQANTVKIGVSTSAHGRVVPIFGSSTGAARELLDSHGLGDFFADSAAAGRRYWVSTWAQRLVCLRPVASCTRHSRRPRRSMPAWTGAIPTSNPLQETAPSRTSYPRCSAR